MVFATLNKRSLKGPCHLRDNGRNMDRQGVLLHEPGRVTNAGKFN
jgi:hypothetical protein